MEVSGSSTFAFVGYFVGSREATQSSCTFIESKNNLPHFRLSATLLKEPVLGGTTTKRLPHRFLPPSYRSWGIKDWTLEPPMPKFNASQELREQIINIIDDLVDRISPGYLPPNSIFPKNYRNAIYEEIYKSLWREFGRKRSEYADYRDEVFDFLREVPSKKIFTATELLLKVVCRIIYIQKAIPDNIIRDPNAGNELWSRKASVRDRHISLFKDSVDDINDRILKNNSKCLYNLEGESIQLVRLDTGLDVAEGHNSIQEPNDNQIQEHHQNQSRSEFWNKRNFIIAVIALIFIILDFAFGDRILIRIWNYLPTIKEKIADWFR